MQQLQQGAAPLTSCSQQHRSVSSWTHILGLLAVVVLFGALLSGCGPRVVVKPLNVAASHPAKFECQRADGSSGAAVERPAIPALPSEGPDAVANYKALKEAVLAREFSVATYLLAVEGINFTCWSNMEWQKDFYKGVD